MEPKAEELYKQLVENLDQLVKVYRSLLEVVRKEKDILIAAQLEELTENNKTKDSLLIRIRSLENSRMKCARDLAQLVGADVDAPRLLDLAVKFEAERSTKLRNMHSVLDLLIRRVSEVNKQNEELVQSALKNINGAMDSIRDTLQPKATYGRKGALVGHESAVAGNLVGRDV